MKKTGIIALAVVSLSMNFCGGSRWEEEILTAPRYNVSIYYKNANGEDLLDPTTMGHFNDTDIKINGEGLGVGEFSVSNVQINPTLPKGYSIQNLLSPGGSYPRTDLITLSSSITDKLSTTFSGAKLTSCKYNGVEVLPANLSAGPFQITVVK